MTLAAIALGSNLGDREKAIRSALRAIGALPATTLVRTSTIIETPPVGPEGQGPYLNAVCLVETSLPARDLLSALLEIERDHGRDRDQEHRWGPRTLDLDLILFGDELIDEPGLSVPHPSMHERDFVLIPLAEIAPELKVPGRRQMVRDLLDQLHSPGEEACS